MKGFTYHQIDADGVRINTALDGPRPTAGRVE